MNYENALEYLFRKLPMYQRIGKAAFKQDLTNIIALLGALENPQDKFRTVHIGGTNGKGSSTYLLQRILSEAGYKTGTYTSPHLKSFTERIRIDGADVEEFYVAEFVSTHQKLIEKIEPSFFEITVAMAFQYFADRAVDVAIIEVGLGGRLDSTNILAPLVSLITNISYDHQDLLGDTLAEIAGEKAGIIKPGTPVVIGESNPETDEVFIRKAAIEKAPIQFADQEISQQDSTISFNGNHYHFPDGTPDYLVKNSKGVLCVVKLLRDVFPLLRDIDVGRIIDESIKVGLSGRWQILQNNPLVVCDTGHNIAGVKAVVNHISNIPHERLFIVWGMVNDKEATEIMRLLPNEASYIFCQSSVPRAMPASQVQAAAKQIGLEGKVIQDVNEAIEEAKKEAGPNDLIFIGGSTFVVAEIKGL